jgi:excisionase family DNA binding protein
MSEDCWYTPIEAARELIGVDKNTLYNWIWDGVGPHVYKINGRWLYKKKDVEEWVAKRKQIMEDPLYRVLGVVETSKRLGIHKNTLLRWIHEGNSPPTFIFNGKYVFKEKDVEKWIEEKRCDGSEFEEGAEQPRHRDRIRPRKP